MTAIGAVYCILLGVKFAKAEEPQEHEKAKNHMKNAIIGYGLLEKKEGGTIRLHTWTENGSNIIQISDDGVGFDTEQPAGEDSVGLKNVRFRLRYMVNGTMEIKSRPQEGTTVTITIPEVRTETKDKGKRK